MTEQEFDEVRAEIGANAVIEIESAGSADAIFSTLDDSDSFLVGATIGKSAAIVRVKKSDVQALGFTPPRALVGQTVKFDSVRYRVASVKTHPASEIVHLTICML